VDKNYRPYGWRAKLGLIVPPTNTVNEAEWARMAPEGVTLHVTRMALHTDTDSAAGKRALREDLRRAVTDLKHAGVDVIAYACTAGSMLLPLDSLTSYMQDIAGVPAVATAPALVHACRALGASAVALATPYHQGLNDHERHFLQACGIEVVRDAGLGIGAGGVHEYVNIARLPKEQVFFHCASCDDPAAQALLISCTDFAAMEAIPRLEAHTGKPAVSSNLATFWLALRTAGVEDRLTGFGQLLEHC
jgi:maleate cis-trans isomerase